MLLGSPGHLRTTWHGQYNTATVIHLWDSSGYCSDDLASFRDSSFGKGRSLPLTGLGEFSLPLFSCHALHFVFQQGLQKHGLITTKLSLKILILSPQMTFKLIFLYFFSISRDSPSIKQQVCSVPQWHPPQSTLLGNVHACSSIFSTQTRIVFCNEFYLLYLRNISLWLSTHPQCIITVHCRTAMSEWT